MLDPFLRFIGMPVACRTSRYCLGSAIDTNPGIRSSAAVKIDPSDPGKGLSMVLIMVGKWHPLGSHTKGLFDSSSKCSQNTLARVRKGLMASSSSSHNGPDTSSDSCPLHYLLRVYARGYLLRAQPLLI